MIIHNIKRENGVTRVKTKFAFLPIRINNKIIWLQKYHEKQIGILDWNLEFLWEVKERWV